MGHLSETGEADDQQPFLHEIEGSDEVGKRGRRDGENRNGKAGGMRNMLRLSLEVVMAITIVVLGFHVLDDHVLRPPTSGVSAKSAVPICKSLLPKGRIRIFLTDVM